jgi:hypothetical protein
MPKFEKGSIEMKNHIAELRAKRGNKRPISTHKEVSKEHIQNIVNEALEKYYLVSTPVVEVSEKLVTINKNGKAKLIDTLTKAGNLKKIDGENVITLESSDNLNVKSVGTKYNADDILKTIPSQTIVHKVEPKKTKSRIQATTKDYNDDVIDVKNENIPIQKIIHNPQNKTIRRAKQEPYSDLHEFKTIDIEPEKGMQIKPSQIIVHKTVQKTTKKKEVKPVLKSNDISPIIQNEDTNSPYSGEWKWSDDYFKKSGDIQGLMREYAKTKDKTIIKKIKDYRQYIKAQQALNIEHLYKLLKRGDPDVTQDIINKRIMLNKKEDDFYKKKIDDFEK